MPKARLDVLVARRGLAESREAAKRLVLAGLVRVDGERVDKAGAQVGDDAVIDVQGPAEPYASRGGRKLAAALDTFKLDVRGVIAADIGASTGGFTDCLLQHGAAHVYALDVGYGQLAWELRNDPRVTVEERVNARTIKPDHFPTKPGLLVMDVSFISVRTVFPAVAAAAAPDATAVILVKPQFEAGRAAVGKGGVVRDTAARRAAVNSVTSALVSWQWNVRGETDSPVRGPAGNVEFLVWTERGAGGCPCR